MKINFKRVLSLGLIIGIILLILQIVFKIDSSKLMSYYWKIGVAIILLLAIINTIYFVVFSVILKKKLQLFYEGKYDQYNREMEKILQRAKGENLKNIIRINLSAGYIGNNEYESAKEVLDKVELLRLRDEKLRLVYSINRCVCDFKLENYEKFKEDYMANQELFKKYETEQGYAESIAQLEITKCIVEKDFSNARELLYKTRDKYKDSKIKEDYSELEKIINENISEKYE